MHVVFVCFVLFLFNHRFWGLNSGALDCRQGHLLRESSQAPGTRIFTGYLCYIIIFSDILYLKIKSFKFACIFYMLGPSVGRALSLRLLPHFPVQKCGLSLTLPLSLPRSMFRACFVHRFLLVHSFLLTKLHISPPFPLPLSSVLTINLAKCSQPLQCHRSDAILRYL